MNDRNDGALRAKRCFGEPCIEDVNRLFAPRSAMHHALSDAARAAEVAFRMSAMEAAMKCLGAQGAFDVAPERNTRIVAVAAVPPERPSRERGLRLNPPMALIDGLSEAAEP